MAVIVLEEVVMMEALKREEELWEIAMDSLENAGTKKEKVIEDE